MRDQRGMRDRWRVAQGGPVDLSTINPAGTAGAPGDKETTKATLRTARHAIADLQARLWAERRQSLLLVLQAMDAGGKDGTVKHVFRGVNPMGCRVTSFKVPTEEEREHDFLWRIHKVTPRAGEIAVFNRSHYEDVLAVRVHDLVPESVWRPRFAQIVAFEELLAAAGTSVVKVFLHISPEEQAERLQARLDRADKRWKFRRGDLDERRYWQAHQQAYEEAVLRTSTSAAPWYIVPADHKWYRNWAVSQILIETLTEMDPRFPRPTEDLTGVEIPEVSA